MKTNFGKLFELAKQEGLEGLQIEVSGSNRMSFSYFQGSLDSYSVQEQKNLVAVGLFGGKLAVYRTEKFEQRDFPEIISALKEAAKYKSETSTVGLYGGAKKYKRRKKPLSDVGEIGISEKIALVKSIAEKAMAYDPRIDGTVQCFYSESSSESFFQNDKGIKLKDKDEYFSIALDVPATSEGVTKDNGIYRVGRTLGGFDADGFVKEAAEATLSKFGGEPIASGNYPTVIKNEVMASLIPSFVSAASAEEIERKTSFLLGKLGQPVASKKVTISEKPLEPTTGYYFYDSEGVPAMSKDIVKNGVLATYLYNRETAAKAGTDSTGNGSLGSGRFGIGFSNIFLKPGKKTFEEMISKIKKGVYVTDVAGLGTGLNETSGDFSLQAEGFLIEDGKLTKPLALITLGGNLLSMLASVKDLDNRVSREGSASYCPDAYISSMAIGGK